jgi:hypothetical protein
MHHSFTRAAAHDAPRIPGFSSIQFMFTGVFSQISGAIAIPRVIPEAAPKKITTKTAKVAKEWTLAG